MKPTILPAQETEEPILRNLLQLYLHDFSEFDALKMSDEGEFDYPYLACYWSESDRYPFLLKMDDVLAGFALVRRNPDRGGEGREMEITEFFVLRRYRRRGVGRAAVVQLFDMFPGRWVVEVLEANRPAHQFWDEVISGYTQERFRSEVVNDGEHNWMIYRFEAPGGAQQHARS